MLKYLTPLIKSFKMIPHLIVQVQIPLVATLWIGSGIGWRIKGFGPDLQKYQVWARFQVLNKGVNISETLLAFNFLLPH